MKLLQSVYLLCLLTLMPGMVLADSREEITTLINYYADMWNERDFEALRNYYHSDFVLINEDGPASANQRLEDLKVITESDEDAGQMAYSRLQVSELGEKHAVAYGLMELKFKDGSDISVWFSTVYLNTPFGWKALLTRN